MRTSQAGIDHIIHFESSGRARLKAYRCPAGKWTIGHGHTSEAGEPEVVEGMVITEREAMEIFRQDLQIFEEAVERLVRAPLTQGQFDALVDFAFNSGERNLRKSTLLKVLNKGQYDRVPAELMKWVKAYSPITGGLETSEGLVRRRRAACVLWRGLDDAKPVDVEETRATPEPTPPPKTMTTSREGWTSIVAGGATSVEVVNQAQQAMDGASSVLAGLESLVTNPKFLVLVGVVAACAAIWFLRRQRLKEEGA